MTKDKTGEHFIPVRQDELVEVLCGECALAGPDAEPFRQLCRLVTAVAAFEHYQRLERLKAAYAPFDPDADTIHLQKWTAEHKQQRLNALFTEFTGLKERANFT